MWPGQVFEREFQMAAFHCESSASAYKISASPYKQVEESSKWQGFTVKVLLLHASELAELGGGGGWRRASLLACDFALLPV